MNFNEWKQLAEDGKAEAQYNLGLLYSLGKEIPKNDSEAIKWIFAQPNRGLLKLKPTLV